MTVEELIGLLSHFREKDRVYLADNLTIWEVDRVKKGRSYPSDSISVLLFSGEMAKASDGNLVMLYEEELPNE
jgi:hypothetical protein